MKKLIFTFIPLLLASCVSSPLPSSNTPEMSTKPIVTDQKSEPETIQKSQNTPINTVDSNGTKLEKENNPTQETAPKETPPEETIDDDIVKIFDELIEG